MAMASMRGVELICFAALLRWFLPVRRCFAIQPPVKIREGVVGMCLVFDSILENTVLLGDKKNSVLM